MATMDFTTKPLMLCDALVSDNKMESWPLSGEYIELFCMYRWYCERMRVGLSSVRAWVVLVPESETM